MKEVDTTSTQIEWVRNGPLIEKLSQSQEIAFVVDTQTGEILDAATYIINPERLDYVDVRQSHKTIVATHFTRNSRRIARERGRQMKYSNRREWRQLRSIEDVRNKDDLEAVLGDYSWCPAMSSVNGAWMVAEAENLSARAKDFVHKFTAQQLQALNYGVVSNTDIKKLFNDRSGNYNIYMRQLQNIDFIRVRDISKTERLIAINPLLGFRGTEKMRQSAIQQWYRDSNPHRKYEDGRLEAA